MARVRLAAYAALVVVLLLGAALAPPASRLVAMGAAAAVGWPPSPGLVVAEVVTGGASASDEYIELANTGSSALDLAGLEVAYATSSGATVTRKASWTVPLVVGPGQRVLIANALGAWAATADATYSGGLAATGGAIVLRPVGGTPVDAVGWGDAVNAFVEGTAAAAPPAGSSIDRPAGDTNQNSLDFVVNPAPLAQWLGAGPVPSPSPTPSAAPSTTPSAPSEATPSPTPAPTPAPTAAPTPTPTAEPTWAPTLEPMPSPSLDPTPSPTPEPTATSTPSPSAQPTAPPTPEPTPSPTPEATPGPTPTPTPQPTATPTSTPGPTTTPDPAITIAAARGLPDGVTVVVEATVTLGLGSIDGGRAGFVQDATAGIGVYLHDVPAGLVEAGARVRLRGTLDTRYAQRVLRVSPADITLLGAGSLPGPLGIATGEAGEPNEGLRLTLAGTVTEAPTQLADGLGVTVDDGTGPIRLIVGTVALGDAPQPRTGDVVAATGPLGQRDSGSSGVAGYRLYAMLAGELVVVPTPTPSATPSATPTPAPSVTPAPSATPVPSATPAPTSTVTPAPSATPPPTTEPTTVGDARLIAVGRTTTVRGVVLAEAGRLGTPSLFAVGDATGGLPVRLADGQAGPARGAVVELRGVVADPYGQLELRLAAGGLEIVGSEAVPAAVTLRAGEIGEGTEGRLARVRGTVTAAATRSTSGDTALTIEGVDGASLRILADGSAGIDVGALRKGATVTLTGIVGQRASRKGALDGYRLWLRGRADVSVAAAPSATPRPSSSAAPTAAPLVSVARALAREDQRVTVEGTVTVDRTLLDASGRRAIIEDGTAAVEIYLAAPDRSIRSGVRVQVTGTVGRAWGAPRIRVEATRVLGQRTLAPSGLRAVPTASREWELVRVRGVLSDVRRSGDRWTAELVQGSLRVPLVGLAGAGVPASSLVEGRQVTVTGIVKRPYPTATDQRFAVVPRSPRDVVAGPAKPSSSPGAATAVGPGPSAAAGPAGSPGSSDDAIASDVALADLAASVGSRVRVGGLVTEVARDRVRLDDGTGSAAVVLEGGATDLLTLLAPGDAVNATGTPDERDGGVVLVVDDPADLVLLGDLGGGGEPSEDAGDGPPRTAGAVIGPDAASAVARLTPAAGSGSLAVAVGTLLLTALIAGGAVTFRVVRVRRQAQARIRARLDAIAAPRPPAEPASP